MKTKMLTAMILASLFAGPVVAMTADRVAVDKIIAGWADRPRLGASQMLVKYGLPQEATSQQLVWHNPGPFKRIAVMNLETPHDFPLPHVDYMEHTISYDVPQAKVGDLIAFDGSSTINRTVGELSARCDLEAHNVLTLNLDHDIVTGKKTVAQARQAFAEIIGEDVTGKHPAYVESLQFKPASVASSEFSDKPVIPGSPLRASDTDQESKTRLADNGNGKADSEILAIVIAIDLNEVLAASEAEKKRISAPALNYAKMLHEQHGASMVKTMKLGQEIGVTPTNTAAVEKMKMKAAGELAAMVMLDGEDFERKYLAAMGKGHSDVLSMIDGKLLEQASDAALKTLLTEKRASVAAHLESTQQLQRDLVADAASDED